MKIIVYAVQYKSRWVFAGNRTLPASFLKAAIFNEENQAYSCAFENI